MGFFGSIMARSPRDAELAFLALLLRWAEDQPFRQAPPDEEELRNFYRAVGNYYKASPGELEQVCSASLPLDEVAVAFHVARNAGVPVTSYLELRTQGLGSMDILSLLNVNRDALYVPVGSPTTVFPGQSHEDLRGHAREAWSDPDLSDSDITNLVNLKFIAEYYGWRAEHVIALRSGGWSFAAIHGDLGKSPTPARPANRRH
jgi:hypothetical protein